MKIVYLTSSINPKDGGGRYSSDLIYGIKKLGHEVFILKEKDDGLEGVPILRRGVKVFSSAFKIRKYLKGADIIHALDGYPYAIIAVLANLGLNKKLIITGVGTYAVSPLYNYKISLLLKWAYKRATRVVTISHYTKNEIINKIALREVEVICPGIRYELFYKPHEKSDECYLLSVGALKRRKGYHISILAFALAKKKIENLKYVIIGNQNDQNYFNHLKKLAVDYRVEKDVVFLSNISDDELSRLYSRAKIFIMLSVNEKNNFEGYGLVFLEAAAAGLPVIGTTNNGITDAVKDGFNGVLVNQNDVEVTSSAIINILEDKGRWQEMSANSYQWAKEHDWLDSVKKYLVLYEKVLAK